MKASPRKLLDQIVQLTDSPDVLILLPMIFFLWREAKSEIQNLDELKK